MKKIIITGHTSSIAIALIETIKAKYPDLKIIKVGRSPDSDVKINFFELSDMKKFVTLLENEKPHYLFLNHGVLHGKKLNSMSDNEIKETISCNMLSYLSTLEVLPSLPHLRTVLMSSISAKAGSFATLYAASKAGVDLVLKNIIKDLPATSRLNAVSPGIIADAKMTTVRQDKDVLAKKKEQTPTKEFTTSNEIAKTVHYLLFENDSINGENINVNGGIWCD